jgi:hypothetical protein
MIAGRHVPGVVHAHGDQRSATGLEHGRSIPENEQTSMLSKPRDGSEQEQFFTANKHRRKGRQRGELKFRLENEPPTTTSLAHVVIFLPLIPEDRGDAHRGERSDHAVVELPRLPRSNLVDADAWRRGCRRWRR